MIAPPPDDDGSFAFGQREPLAVRIRGLIREYPRDLGLLKEFIQNADDAGASTVRMTLDLREWPKDSIENDYLKAALRPALVVQNNRPFSDQDFNHIQRLGDSGKLVDPAKIGRFGRGFNTVYNVTDLPLILSAGWLAACDPHQRIFGHDKTGQAWRLSHASKAPLNQLLVPFLTYGYDGGSSYKETLFRLPLRDSAAASTSQLTTEPFESKDFHLIVEQAAREGSALLIFCRNVLDLELAMIDREGRHTSLLRIESEDVSGVQAERNRRLAVQGRTNLEVLAALAKGVTTRPPFRHTFKVVTPAKIAVESWLISVGYSADPALLTLACQLAEVGERALPLAGAAARLQSLESLAPAPLDGRFFCGLPLPEKSQSPVHINGAFDIDSSRQGLFRGQGVIGQAAQRAQWNQLLTGKACASHYANLIISIATTADAVTAAANYALLPVNSGDGGYADVLHKATLELLINEKWVRAVCGDDVRVEMPRDVYQAPAGKSLLEETLVALGVPILRPAMPSDVLKSRSTARIVPKTVNPTVVRDLIRSEEQWERPLAEAEPRALRSLDAVEAVATWLVSDDPADLDGLPLAYLKSGKLSVFSDESPTLLATDAQAAALVPSTARLIDPAFAERTGFSTDESEAYRRVGHEDLVSAAKVVCSLDADASTRAWSPKGAELPNQDWLASLFEAILDVETPPGDLYQDLPIIPDRHGLLHRPGFYESPLLASAHIGSALQAAFDKIRAPIIGGSARIRKALATLSEPSRRLVWPLEQADLIGALDGTDEWQSIATEHLAEIELIVEWIAEGCEDLSDEVREKLLNLPIFPTTNGTLVAAKNENVFVASELKLPKVDSEFVVLATGTFRSSLYASLDIPSLNRVEFVRTIVLPVFEEQSGTHQHKLLTWIRDEHSRILADAGAARGELIREISDTPLVRLTDGSLVPIRSIYAPDAEADDPIASRAAKISGVYKSEWSLWRPFFNQFGMVREGRAEDLIEAVQELSAQDTSDALFAKATTIFSWTMKDWERLFHDGGQKLVNALDSARWIPAQRGKRLTKGYASATEPEQRLFRPNEIVPARLGHLVASQLPIAMGGLEPPTAMRSALKMLGAPSVTIVQRHIEQVISNLTHGEGDTVSEQVAKALAEFYRYCGSLRDHDADAMARWAGDRSLVWNPAQRKLVSADHVFTVDVNRFHPRWMKQRGEQAQERGLDLLGRRSEVATDDLQKLLLEIAEEYGGGVISQVDHEIVFHALHHLKHLSASLPSDIPVITKRRTLAPAANTLRCDVKEWLALVADHPSINVLHDDLGIEIAHAAKVARASDVLTEALEGDPVPSNDQHLIGHAERLERHLRSAEFSIGMRRVIAAEHGTTREDLVEWLREISVVAVRTMALRLYAEDGEIDLGAIDSRSYFDREALTLFTSEGEKRRRDLFVSRIINDMLGDYRLANREPLSAIIRCAISDIEGELDDQHIERLDGRDWREPEASIDNEDIVVEAPSAEDDDDESDHRTGDADGSDDGSSNEGVPGELPSRAVPGSRPRGGAHAPEPGNPDAGGGSETRGGGSHAPGRSSAGIRLPGRTSTRSATGAADRSENQRRLVSYVRSVGNLADGDDETSSSEERKAIDEAAVATVLAQETVPNTTVRQMPHLHPGWDVEVSDGNGVIVKRIEIKGTRGSWGERGVGLTPTQMEAAREHREGYWLYVVEHALTKPRVFRIQNPADYVDRYMFDGGWRQVCEDASPEPFVGMEIRAADGILKIVEVLSGGKAKLIRVEQPDGNRRLIPWTKDTITLPGASG